MDVHKSMKIITQKPFRLLADCEKIYQFSQNLSDEFICRKIAKQTTRHLAGLKVNIIEQIPEDKIIFIIQIMQGLKGLDTDEDMRQREEAFLHLEKMRKKVPDLDYDRELAEYREEKYGLANIG